MEKSKDIKIYSLCYSEKEWEFLDDAVVTPLQVGADVSRKNVCDVKDNTGDNISKENWFYIENTGTYWIWKNVKSKYKGQMQYRRPLTGVNETMDFDDIFKEYDVITCTPFNHPQNSKPTLKNPTFIPANTVEEGYAFSNCGEDLKVMEFIVKKEFPEYAEDYDKYIKKGENLYYSNGFIMKEEDYDRYCEFLFKCLNTWKNISNIENQQNLANHVVKNMYLGKYIRYTDLSQITNPVIKWQMSIGGFLSERLWTLWVLHNFSKDRILTLPYHKMEENMYT